MTKPENSFVCRSLLQLGEAPQHVQRIFDLSDHLCLWLVLQGGHTAVINGARRKDKPDGPIRDLKYFEERMMSTSSRDGWDVICVGTNGYDYKNKCLHFATFDLDCGEGHVAAVVTPEYRDQLCDLAAKQPGTLIVKSRSGTGRHLIRFFETPIQCDRLQINEIAESAFSDLVGTIESDGKPYSLGCNLYLYHRHPDAQDAFEVIHERDGYTTTPVVETISDRDTRSQLENRHSELTADHVDQIQQMQDAGFVAVWDSFNHRLSCHSAGFKILESKNEYDSRSLATEPHESNAHAYPVGQDSWRVVTRGFDCEHHWQPTQGRDGRWCLFNYLDFESETTPNLETDLNGLPYLEDWAAQMKIDPGYGDSKGTPAVGSTETFRDDLHQIGIELPNTKGQVSVRIEHDRVQVMQQRDDKWVAIASKKLFHRPTNTKTYGVPASSLVDSLDEPVDWYVDGVFTMDQPAAFGAASKTLKTTVLIDLSVALVTKTDWLGHFKIPKRRNVLLITGESNNRATMRRIDRAARARGLSVSDLKTLYIETVNFPKLPSVDDREMLRRTVAEKQIDIVIVDPLYRGLGNLDTNRLAEMADSIVQFAKAAQPAATIIAHHIIKSAAKLKNGKVPALEDMSGAGLAESVGQWWLVGRNEEYKHDRRHDLGVQYGGRDEQCGSLRILVQEDDWTFDIESMGDYRNAKKEAREKAKAENLELEVTDTMGAISQLLKTETVAKPKSFIESQSGKSVAITRKALSRMILEGDVVQQKYGNRNGWILKCNAQ